MLLDIYKVLIHLNVLWDVRAVKVIANIYENMSVI